MGNFRYWRKMTWALVLWSAGGLAFIVYGGFALPAIVITAVGLIVLGFIWYMTRPLWRVGHGARFRQMRSADIPFKLPRTVAQD
jgi:O-antigen/teichoic acid export membrane protein